MPRWPEQAGLEVRRLGGFTASGSTFTLAFPAADAPAGARVSLVFDGIATAWTAELNGREIARAWSMFQRVEADVTTLLAGANTLTIRCVPEDELLATQPKRPRQRWRTKVVENAAALRFVRTSVLGRAPGFAPGPPVTGPWRPVWLVTRSAPVPEDVALRPRVEGDHGVLAVRARVVGARRVEAVVANARAALTAGEDGVFSGEVRIPDIERWWPYTHGAPRLYDVRLEVDGEDVGLGRTGFRTLGDDAAAPVVNDVAIFARGVVWTPVPEGEERATLTLLRDAGINMVRIPGIGVYETPAFHDLCDELGILVWQDFAFANMDYPIEDEGFREAVVAEARALLAEVGGRPSLAVLCGNSEVEQQAAMFGVDAALGRGELFGALLPGLAREAGVDVPYVPSAPSGGVLPFHPREGVANYFGVGGYRRPLSDARTAGVRFASECLAFANVPDGDVEHGSGVARDAGADWDFADVRDHYLRERYGVDRDHPRYWDLSRQVSGEMMALVFGEWRRAASPTAGGLILWSRDLRPGAGWGVVAHDGRPKVALAHLRRALAPRALWIADEGLNGLDVHLANDRPDALEAELEVALLADGTHAIADARTAADVAPRSVGSWNVEALLGRFADASYAYRFGPPAHDTVVATLRAGDDVLAQAVHFPLGPPTAPTAFALDARLEGEAVTLATDRVAWGVRIAAAGFAPADDAFTLVPGVPRTIPLLPHSPDARFAAATVTALNLIGEAPVSAPDLAP
jgi:beta-mannosidase